MNLMAARPGFSVAVFTRLVARFVMTQAPRALGGWFPAILSGGWAVWLRVPVCRVVAPGAAAAAGRRDAARGAGCAVRGVRQDGPVTENDSTTAPEPAADEAPAPATEAARHEW